MCQIQLVYSLSGYLDKDDFKKFKELMRKGAKYNDDAHGYIQLTDENMYWNKSNYLESLFKSMEHNTNTRIIIGHNRLATAGTKEYPDNHPFQINKNLFWVHNGVINNNLALREKYKIPDTVKTDSFVIGWLVNYYLEKGAKLTKAIRKTFEQIKGSYSVVLYCASERRIFYIKNNSTSFCFFLDKSKNMIFGTTDYSNMIKEKVFGLYETYDAELVPCSNYLYELTRTGIKKLFEIDKPEEETAYYSRDKPEGFTSLWDYDEKARNVWDYDKKVMSETPKTMAELIKQEDEEDEESREFNKSEPYKGRCCTCGKKTKVVNIEGWEYCLSCLEYNEK